ncbi:MAG TPA: SpoIVB peptidase S55 domain-containing protein [Terriglobia bacterium]|nr:SpoIVB peptidase S55 domain-containing protein [Terriglobia bacterium]
MRLPQVLKTPSRACGMAFSLTLLMALLLWPAPSPVQGGQEPTTFFPLSDVHAGLKGVGKTVFQGDTVSEFQVEVLGVLKNVLAPKHNAILVRLSGPEVEKTGVVAGMSGSPVYVDGKLVGAVAVSFPFSKEPYGLVTPIEDMLAVTPHKTTAGVAAGPGELQGRAASFPGRFAPVAGGSAGEVRFIPDGSEPWVPQAPSDEPAGLAGLLAGLRLPLRFSGFDSNLIRQNAAQFRALGLEPVEGGGLTGASSSGGASPPASAALLSSEAARVTPGQMVSLLFVSGDFNLAADCTVTYREGDRIYACGHQVFQTGSTDIPFAPARVLATIPSLTVSFKVDDPGLPVGSIHQDRFGAIYGELGQQASTIPVSIRVNSDLRRAVSYRLNVAQAPLLSPLLVQLALASAISGTERGLGPSTLNLTGAIRLVGGETVNLEDVLASDSGAAAAAGAAVATPLNFLLSSGFPGLQVEGIEVELNAQDRDSTARLDAAWASRSEVRPGDSIEVTAVVRTPSGEALTQKIPMRIPDSVSSKILSLVVGGGPAINALEGRLTPLSAPPRDLHQMVRALNEMRRDNRLYALLLAPESSFRLQGSEFPSPPPSLLQTFLSDPAAASRVTLSPTSVVGDFGTGPMPYTITGQQTLLLKVIRPGE